MQYNYLSRQELESAFHIESRTLSEFGANDTITYDKNILDYSITYDTGAEFGSSDYTILIVDFKLKDTFTDSPLFLYSIYFDFGTIGGTGLLLKDDTNSSTFSIEKIILLENAYAVLREFDINNNNDIPTSTDIGIFDNLKSCDSLDIGCHFDNLITLNKNLFTRIGNQFTNFFTSLQNLFEYLFVPSIDIFEEQGLINQKLVNKLGVLGFPLYILENFVDRIVNIDLSTTTIDLPPLKEPFSDTTIWSGGSYDLTGIMTTGSLGVLYRYYRLFVGAYLVFMFIGYCENSFEDILRGSVGRAPFDIWDATTSDLKR